MERGTMKFVASVLLMMGLFGPASSYSFRCPPPEEVRPCICVHSTVICQKRNMTLQELKKPLTALDGANRWSALTLRLRYANVSILTLEIFERFEPYELEILDCSLKNITNYSNLTLPDIKRIKILHSVNDTTGKFQLSLRFFTRLESLDLSFNVIKKLRKELFASSPQSLTSLSLQSSHIEMLDEGVFADLSGLKFLYLDGNNIRVIASNSMPSPAYSLKMLDLSHNNLTSIEEGFFSDMVSLESVRIDYNKIRELPEKIWEPVWLQLNSLFIYQNPLRCDKHIEWIFRLRKPKFLTAYCVSPPERKGMSLDQLIKINRPKAIPKPTAHVDISS